MKVQLINPPASEGVDIVREGRCMQRGGAWTAVWAPISLATIAAVLERENVECRLDDCIIEKLGLEALRERARGFGPDMVVVNTATPSIDSDLFAVQSLKEDLPGAVFLAIGIHVSALPEETLMQCHELDAVVRGEPELTVRDAARAVSAKNDLSAVPGLSVRKKDELIHGPDREPADLDSLPAPAWHLARTDLYRMPFSGDPFLLVGTSRGCPFHCRFCADPVYYGHALRLKSPERIVTEMEEIREKYGIRDFLFWSESFTLKREWTVRVLNELTRSGADFRIVCNSRTDHVDPELLSLMREAGVWMVGYGVESGSQFVLDLMNKKTSVEQNRKAITWTKEAGLQATAHMVIGYPGETRETVQETIDFACSLPLDYAQFYCAAPFPGSTLYREAKEKGLLRKEPWTRFEQNYCVLDTPELSAREVMEWRKKAYRRFYASPARAWRVLKRDVGWKRLPRFGRMMLSFRGWI
ncbi:MAG: radical SAM protein [bacterium]